MCVCSFVKKPTPLWVFLWLALAHGSYAQSTRPGLGAVPYADAGGTGYTFRTWAPNATSVVVRGTFNGWGNTAMIREGTNGNWSVDIRNVQPGQEYKYRINGVDKRDPRSRRVISSAGNSIVYNTTNFNWGTAPKPAPARNDAVIYQMHIGTFEGGTPPRTFDQAITRLDHVKNLGASVIKLMPVNEFPGGLSWGYNPTDQFSMESSYGSADGLKRFVKACHERGIAVFMDVVHNHYGPTDLDMWQYDGWSMNNLGGIYFYNDATRANTDWGNTRPDFGRAEVRSFIRDQIMMYVEEYRMGGFRWDSVFNILYYGNSTANFNNDGFTLLRDINWELSQTYPEVIRGSEDHAFDQPMNFEYVWDVGWRWNIHGQLTQGADANRSMATVKNLYDGWQTLNRVLFTEAHDYVGQLNGRTRLPSEIDSAAPESIWARKRALLGGAIVMTAPGIPMIFQGQEMHETLQWHDSVPLRWTRTNTFDGIVRAYRDLIHLRRNIYGGMNGLKGTGINVNKTDEQNKVVTFIRWNTGGQVDDVMGVINFSATMWTNTNYLVDFPSTGTWYRYFNSDSTNYASDFGHIGADTVVASGNPPRAAVNMGMYSLQLFSKTPANFVPVAPSVAFNPPSPTGCVQVAITYNTGTGPLKDATQVNIYFGRNGWLSTTNLPMTSLGSNNWQHVHTLTAGTLELNMAFNNGISNIWDNNNGQNWALPVVACNAIQNTNPVDIVFTTAEQTVIADTLSGVISIQLVDENNQTALSTNNSTIALRSSLAGTFRNAGDTATITSVVISNGQSSASFRYTSATPGTHQLTVSNAALPIATQPLTVTPPPDPFDLLVLGNGAVIADGSTTPAASNNTYFGEVFAGTNFSCVFTVTNTGAATLGLGGLQISGAASSDFTAVNPLPASLAAGQATNLTIQFTPSASGLRSATLSFTNSTSAKSPYNFTISGTGVVPVIALSVTSITATTTAGNSPAPVSFAVTNTGSGVMAYTASVNQAWLSIAPASGSVTAGAGQSHTVNFSTAGLSAGSYSATVTVSSAFASNDPRRISVALTVNPSPPATRLVFTNAPRTMAAGETSDLLTIALADAQGNYVASTNNRMINLATDKLGTFRGATGTNIISAIVISNGQSRADFRYNSSSEGAHIIVASDSGSLGSVTQTLTISSFIVQQFSTNTQFTVPAGVSQLTVEAWGGGGGALRNGTTRRPGGGGGAYARSTLNVVPGAVFNVVVGQGGAAGNPAAAGGDSSFGNSAGTNLLAKGGGGASGTSTVGPGGSANTSISTDGIRFPGGAGGARGPTGGGGGGGGGSAFTTANGTVGSAGTSTSGGAGGAGTGSGGNGGAPNTPGLNGTAPGGGGGGNGNGNRTSGAGAAGMVRVSYSIVRSGLLTIEPEFPQGCVPLTLTYDDNNGLLAGASQVNMVIGFNNWTFSQTIAMTRVNANSWTSTFTIPEGTLMMEIALNNGANTWDSNGGNNWNVYVTGCFLAEPVSLAITDPPSDITVPYTNGIVTVRGAAERIAGDLVWENVGTGEAGSVPAGESWQLSSAALEVGPNLFRVTGWSNTENPNHGAHDSATNSVYATVWTNGMDGGVRWGGPWEISASGSAGHFIATSAEANLGISTRAWALWANTNQAGTAEARRNFADRLHAGDILTFKFENNWIDNGSTVGFGLRNFFNENLFEFMFTGGGTNYVVNDGLGNARNTGIAWTQSGLSITYELTSPTTYRLEANSMVITGELVAAREVMIREFRAWNAGAGPGVNYNVYFTDLQVTGVPLEPEVLTAQRTVTRKYGPTFNYSTSPDKSQVNLGFPVTEIGYIYEIVGKTNLMDPEWTTIGQVMYGNGESLQVSITNAYQNMYLRTRVRPVE